MKPLYLLLTLLAAPYNARAQAAQYPDCTFVYFANGKVSTSMCYDAAKRFGEARAYNRAGKEIYRQGLRKVAGHASVYFTYYPDKAVRRAEFSDAPDAGIQWSRGWSDFSPTGEITASSVQSYDDSPTTLLRRQSEPAQPMPPAPTVPALPCNPPGVEAPRFEAECWLLNRTRHRVQVVVKAKNSAEQYVIALPANGRDTLKSHSYRLAQAFQAPTDGYTFAVLAAGRGIPQVLPMQPAYRSLGPMRRRYFYVVK